MMNKPLVRSPLPLFSRLSYDRGNSQPNVQELSTAPAPQLTIHDLCSIEWSDGMEKPGFGLEHTSLVVLLSKVAYLSYERTGRRRNTWHTNRTDL